MRRLLHWIIELAMKLDSWHVLLPLIAAIIIALLLIALEITTRTRPLALTWRI